MKKVCPMMGRLVASTVMHVEPFGGDFSLLRDLYSDAPGDLATQEAADPSALRFVRIDGGIAVAEVRLVD